MTYALVLALHLTAAAVTGVVLLSTLFVLWRHNSTLYRLCALVLGSVAAFEILSGTVLAIVSPQLSAAGLSVHIAEYLGVCAIAEAMLFARMHRASLAFPLAAAASPVIASILLFAAALSLGF